MESNKWFINDLVGKTILVRTHGGLGTKDARLILGDYRGVLLGFDGGFLKLEYEVRQFTEGKNATTREVILINAAYIVSINEYKGKDE